MFIFIAFKVNCNLMLKPKELLVKIYLLVITAVVNVVAYKG
ncbi:hypothetical protein SF123566_3014 [Shigella flexneri 1235-66]|nr:hypothetical protein SF123566_3014 [Shigella flexneri 1235-66]